MPDDPPYSRSAVQFGKKKIFQFKTYMGWIQHYTQLYTRRSYEVAQDVPEASGKGRARC